MKNQVVSLNVGQNADFIQIELIIVSAAVLPSRSTPCTDNNVPLGNFFTWQFLDLKEVLNIRVVLVKVSLNFPKDPFHSFLISR